MLFLPQIQPINIMENLNQAAPSKSPADEDDLRQFRRPGIPWNDNDFPLFLPLGQELAREIVLIKENDSSVASLSVEYGDGGWNDRNLRRLGIILAQSKKLISFCINNANNTMIDVEGLCAGLIHNSFIQDICLYNTNLNMDSMNALAPFFSNNPSLRSINLRCCRVNDQACLNIFSNALCYRSEDTLEKIDLSGNILGGVKLSRLSGALIKCRHLRQVILVSCDIGVQGCTSLAKLLRLESNIEKLDLRHNFIDHKCMIVMAEALVSNTNLKTLDMSGGIRTPERSFDERSFYQDRQDFKKGWQSILKLICNTSSIEEATKSNHVLVDMGELPLAVLTQSTASLLRSSFEINKKEPNKALVTRQKIIWGHLRGELNVGRSSIPTAAMPDILAWFNDIKSIQYQIPPPMYNYNENAVKLDCFYRIMRNRADLFDYGPTHICSECRRYWNDNNKLGDENKELREMMMVLEEKIRRLTESG